MDPILRAALIALALGAVLVVFIWILWLEVWPV